MNKKIPLCLILIIAGCVMDAQEKVLKKGMVITENTTIKKAVYKLDASQDLDQPVILIEGYRITVDFNNATLQGSNSNPPAGRQGKNPDEFFHEELLAQKSRRINAKERNFSPRRNIVARYLS